MSGTTVKYLDMANILLDIDLAASGVHPVKRHSGGAIICLLVIILILGSVGVGADPDDESSDNQDQKLAPGLQPEPVEGAPVYNGPIEEGDSMSHSNVLTDQELSRDAFVGCSDPPAHRHFDVDEQYANSWIRYHVQSNPMRIDWYYVHEGITWLWKNAIHDAGTGEWCWENWQNVEGSAMQARPGDWHVEVWFNGNGQPRSGDQQCAGPTTGCVIPFEIWPQIDDGGTYGSSPGDGKTEFQDTDSAVRVFMDWDTSSATRDHTIRFYWYRPGGDLHHVGDSHMLTQGQNQIRLTESISIADHDMGQHPGTWEVRPWINQNNYFQEARYDFELEIDCTRDDDGDNLQVCDEFEQGTSDENPDTDGDGLSDFVESTLWPNRQTVFCGSSGTMCSFPDPLVRDLYVEIDWMQGNAMRTEERTTIIQNFENAPINNDGDSSTDITLHLDTGTLGGGNQVPHQEVLSEADYWDTRDTNFAPAREGIFRYALSACRDQQSPTGAYGWAYTPGDGLVIFDCMPDMDQDDVQAKVFTHELGHNILGFHVHNPDRCSHVMINGQPIMDRHNPELTHFHWNDGSCRGDQTNDVSSHSADVNEVMFGTVPEGGIENMALTYTSQTWYALRLDWGIDGSIQNQCLELPLVGLSPVVDDVLEDLPLFGCRTVH